MSVVAIGAAAVRRHIVRLTFRGRVLAGTLLLFSALVGARIHGSSIALSATTWAPREEVMDTFLAASLLKTMKPKTADTWRSWLMARPRDIRADEWAHQTMWVLAQFTHRPAFPVVNGNIGNGQNMLIAPWVPVRHLSAVAQPLSWGYLLFGPQHGLAWFWWFMLLSGFVTLYLLLEIIVPGRPALALLGAVWFSGSAYVVCWSLWPGYVAAFALFALVCAYRLATSDRPVVVLSSGLGLGLSFAGFVMQLYPPFQVPLGHTMLLIFAGLVVRDRLFQKVREQSRLRLLGLALALVTIALVLGSFIASSKDALGALAASDYPGQRRLHGADTPILRLFGGLYNYYTKDVAPVRSNQSEAAGFFLFFPAVAVALAISKRFRARLDLVTWLLLG